MIANTSYSPQRHGDQFLQTDSQWISLETLLHQLQWRENGLEKFLIKPYGDATGIM